MSNKRAIPSIEQVRQLASVQSLETEFGRTAVVAALRAEADVLRGRLADGEVIDDVRGSLARNAADRLRRSEAGSLRTVINATGVILHTNLGRAPLGAAAARAVSTAATGYCNLEYDLEQGRRGRRDVHAERLICALTGAEAACVVNNNAAATLLTLAALAYGREVIVSRGELVEIGGGFRVPDVMKQSGAILREVGTTNRTRAADYAAAVGDQTALILRIHPSNFRIEGFTERPSVAELVALGRRFNLPVIEDLGSGLLGAAAINALREEPVVGATIRSGVAAVMFSGDKLLGGPQAGIIAGDRVLLDPIRRHPLMRALRVDKMTYAALEATLQAHSAERWEDIPAVQMMHTPAEQIGVRAEALAAGVTGGSFDLTVTAGESTIGGGSAPETTLPTRLIELRHTTLSANELEARLRQRQPPIVARIANDALLLDLRTVFPSDDDEVLKALRELE